MKTKYVKRIVTVLLIFICFFMINAKTNLSYGIELNKTQTKLNYVTEEKVKDISLKSSFPTILNPIIRPPIIDPEYTKPLPESYCMRDDYLLFAQHQDKNGLCWNFAATTSASTTIMKATNEYYDFSELWTGITCYTPKQSYSKVGSGGTFSMQYNAIKRSGLMLESDLPYQNSYIVSNENAEDFYNFYSQYANDNLSELLVSDSSTHYNKSEVDAIKRHILNNGSLCLSFCFNTGFLEDNGVFVLTPNQKNTTSNHAISLIGWDDNYQKEFYLNGSETPTLFKGAWMVLNSYTESAANDGISYIFYEDNNIYDIRGYRYQKDTNKQFYFYDKIESGYAYPINVNGKYYGDLTPKTANTKQLNVFYDDVMLEYSYEISNGTTINGIEIYLDNKDVTDDFSVRIDQTQKRFYIEKEDACYGNYKILVRYSNNQASDTYLNNFFVTHGLIGEEVEFDTVNNSLAFNTGKDLEYYTFNVSNKNYVVYTNTLSGNLSFVSSEQSVYSENSMEIPPLFYQITDGKSCTVSHTIKANSGYELNYNFTVIYCEDLSMQPVKVYYDLAGGVNHSENYSTKLANENTPLNLHAPSREGYDFVGWHIEGEDGLIPLPKNGETYYATWENIHHMGEAPTLYASSYYNEYYNNTNILFLRAVWEKSQPTPVENNNGFATGTIIAVSAFLLVNFATCVFLLIKTRK